MSATNTMSQLMLNFVVTGSIRSGSAVVQSAVSGLPETVCHDNLLHESPSVREEAHERYFGPPNSLPEWLQQEYMSPVRYLNRQVFDNPANAETRIGLRILYSQMQRLDLFDWMHDRCEEGDFCTVHIVRNPVACFVSLKQAEATGVWHRSLNDISVAIPSPVAVVPSELIEFVRMQELVRNRITQACNDTLVVPYRDLTLDFQQTMYRIIDFLELENPPFVQPSFRRLRNRSMRERISNFDVLKRKLPQDVKELLTAEDLY